MTSGDGSQVETAQQRPATICKRNRATRTCGESPDILAELSRVPRLLRLTMVLTALALATVLALALAVFA
jgi:hypothetical protein